jgi:putative pyruvate formate lyase activating enzyme
MGRRARTAEAMLHGCLACGWRCEVDRAVELGPCRTGMGLRVATSYLHFGEEKPIVGRGGSGAIFFAHCDLRCQFCQTARWNVQGRGHDLDVTALANIMVGLQQQGAENINLVTPTHVAPQIVMALSIATEAGLRLPLVWNSGGYDSPETLALLDGLVDVYLPDMKYSDPGLGLKLSGVHNYPDVNRTAVREMVRQVGHLRIGEDGTARRGVLVRHLVMPAHADNTAGVLRWIAANLGSETYLSLMDQYRPAYRAFANPDLANPMTAEEYQGARALAISLGLERLDDQRVTADVRPA